MDLSKLTALRQVHIAKPCPADWDAMTGDGKQRFCETCSCHVNNLAEFGAEEAEELIQSSEHVCVRMTVDASKGVLTRDGWIPRLLLAGAMAATVSGCSEPKTYAGSVGFPTMSEASNTCVTIEEKPTPSDNDTRAAISRKIIVETSQKTEHPKK